jgi:hypothetical protein
VKTRSRRLSSVRRGTLNGQEDEFTDNDMDDSFAEGFFDYGDEGLDKYIA